MLRGRSTGTPGTLGLARRGALALLAGVALALALLAGGTPTAAVAERSPLCGGSACGPTSTSTSMTGPTATNTPASAPTMTPSPALSATPSPAPTATPGTTSQPPAAQVAGCAPPGCTVTPGSTLTITGQSWPLSAVSPFVYLQAPAGRCNGSSAPGLPNSFATRSPLGTIQAKLPLNGLVAGATYRVCVDNVAVSALVTIGAATSATAQTVAWLALALAVASLGLYLLRPRRPGFAPR